MTWSDVLKAPKKRVKKKTRVARSDSGNDYEIDSSGITFVGDYREWREKCQDITSSKMGLKGDTNLLNFLRQHITLQGLRNAPTDGSESKNKNRALAGRAGAHTVMNRIEDVFRVDSGNFLFTQDDVDEMEALLEDLNEIEETESLNPENIKFSGFDAAGKSITWEGHPDRKHPYANGKGNYPSFSLFGGGEGFTKKNSLQGIIKSAIKQLKEGGLKIENMTLRRVDQIEKIKNLKGLRAAFDRVTKDKNNYRTIGRKDVLTLSPTLAIRDLKEMRFDVGSQQKQVKDAADDSEILGTIETVTLDLTRAAFQRLLREFYDKRSQGFTIKKSTWAEQIWGI